MAFLPIAVVLCLAVQQATSDVPGRLVSVIPAPSPDRSDAPSAPWLRRSSVRFGAAQPSCLGLYGPLCGDCNTLWSCVGSAEPVLVQNCEATHPGRPLCEQNACTAQVSEQSQCAAKIQCTGQGYFPDPSNCQQFYFCAGAGNASMLYECPDGYAYNATTLQCTLGGKCHQVNCTAQANRYAEYAGDRRLYAFCLRQLGVLAPVMLRCPGDAQQRFDGTQQRCGFECTETGRFADYADAQAYYECLPAAKSAGKSAGKSAADWLTRHQRCLDGFRFEPRLQQCQWDDRDSWDKQTFDKRSTTQMAEKGTQTSTQMAEKGTQTSTQMAETSTQTSTQNVFNDEPTENES